MSPAVSLARSAPSAPPLAHAPLARRDRRARSLAARSLAARPPRRIRVSASSDDASDSAADSAADADLASGASHAEYVRGVAGIAPPPELPALVAVLAAQGAALVPPDRRAGLHPLCVPVATLPDGRVACVKVGGLGDPDALEVVAANGVALDLLARNCREYVHKAIVEEEAAKAEAGEDVSADADSSAFPVRVAATDPLASELHDLGAFATLGKELAVYCHLRVGKFPDTIEALVRRHLDKGDEMSAFVTCDVYKSAFSGWAAPHWYLSSVYADLGRDEEARDAARFCITDCEWATLGSMATVAECLTRCGWEGKGVEEVRAIVETRRGPNRDAFDGPKDPKDAALEEAAALLDKAAAGEVGAREITQRLAECYSRADRGNLAKLVMASFQM